MREFEDLYEQMGRLVQSTVGAPAEVSAWVPAADVMEEDDAYVVQVELPGVTREDINVDVTGNELVITGEIKERERVGLLRHRTRRIGRFEYRALLPGELDPDNVEARLAEGVLTVRIPKSERAKPHRVQIRS